MSASFVPQCVVPEGWRFPDWAQPLHPEAVRLTDALRFALGDSGILVTHITRAPARYGLPLNCFVTWNRSAQYRGYVPGRMIETELGEPLRGILPVERIIQEFKQLYRDQERGITVAQRVEEHNDRIDAAYRKGERERQEAYWDYARKNIIDEIDGVARHSAQDVLDGIDSAIDATKPKPRGQVISVPNQGAIN